jgi:SAM-dependent methyltransferase
MKKIKIGSPQIINQNNIDLINRIKINDIFLKDKNNFKDIILNSITKDCDVLDVGKCMREKFKLIKSKSIKTLDINDFGDYPDIVFDLCDKLDEGLKNCFDKIICIAVLEHVYNPFKAVENLRSMLRAKGTLFGYVPFLYHYHAPKDLKFQDYFRFSKDALAYLLKDFGEVEIFPIRGRISTPLHLLFSGRWKNYIEKTGINFLLDKLAPKQKNLTQCSGYSFIAKK